jgi:hypothetical protein
VDLGGRTSGEERQVGFCPLAVLLRPDYALLGERSLWRGHAGAGGMKSAERTCRFLRGEPIWRLLPLRCRLFDTSILCDSPPCSLLFFRAQLERSMSERKALFISHASPEDNALRSGSAGSSPLLVMRFGLTSAASSLPLQTIRTSGIPVISSPTSFEDGTPEIAGDADVGFRIRQAIVENGMIETAAGG